MSEADAGGEALAALSKGRGRVGYQSSDRLIVVQQGTGHRRARARPRPARAPQQHQPTLVLRSVAGMGRARAPVHEGTFPRRYPARPRAGTGCCAAPAEAPA